MHTFDSEAEAVDDVLASSGIFQKYRNSGFIPTYRLKI